MTKRAFASLAFAALIAAGQQTARVEAQSSGSLLVISQVYGAGGISGATFRNDFIEVFNRSQLAVNLTGLSVQYTSSTGLTNFSTMVAPLSGVLQPGQYYLLQLASSGGAGAVLPTPNAVNAFNIGNAGKAALVNSTIGLPCNGSSDPCTPAERALILDLVGYGNANFFEGAAAAPILSATTAAVRLQAGCTDTDTNSADFQAATPQPHNMASPVHLCFTPPQALLPHDIQGTGAGSPLVGQNKLVRGVVTARVADGFFIQTPDAEADAAPASSEGLFVFTQLAPATVALGDMVEVNGVVQEFVPAADPNQPPVTRLVAAGDEGSLITKTSQGNPLPATRLVTQAMLAGAALESLEGMRVSMDTASMVVVGPTGGVVPDEATGVVVSDGVFYATFPATPRPVREPGIHAFDHAAFASQCAAAPCSIPQFDGNFERLRVDSDAQAGAAPLDVADGQLVSGVAGVLDFADRTWTVLANPGSLAAGPAAPPAGLAPAPATLFTVASLNLGRLFDTDDDPATSDVVATPANFAQTLARASMAVRAVLGSPDVVGVQDVENVATLSALAAQVNSDAGLACPGSSSCYAALLVEGSDPAGLDVAFLVNGRVLAPSVTQEGLSATFVDPLDGSDDLLFDQPPLVLRGVVDGPSGHNVDVAVVVNQLQSLDGLTAATGSRARERRQKQSVFVAGLLQTLQLSAPVREWGTAPVVSLGADNAYDVNDGFVDVTGALVGTPAAPAEVVLAAADLVEPNFVNLTAGVYSSVDAGNAEAMDHLLVSPASLPLLSGVAVPHVNADFPAVLRNDASQPLRLSDRDPVVAAFVFPADTVAPAISDVPADVTVEGNTLGGAVVNYANPTAMDTLDGPLPVSCAPASGATFVLGATTVSCNVSDAAGNGAAASFIVTVVDTTAPQLTLPAPIGVNASGATATVTYAASALDVVDGPLTPFCTPASGATFPVGTTQVRCQATDAHGNVANGSFSVTVTTPAATLPGSMHGAGHIGGLRSGTEFVFHVKQSERADERGWLLLQNRDASGVSSFVSQRVETVTFTNNPSPSLSAEPLDSIRHQAEPPADTVVFTGIGWWKGRPGYAFEATAEDHGEPGRGHDRMTVVVRDARGTVVLSVTGLLNYGNIQSVPAR